MADIGYCSNKSKDSPFNEVFGVCGEHNMFWSTQELAVLLAYMSIAERFEATDSSKLLFSYLFPLHTVEDVLATGVFYKNRVFKSAKALSNYVCSLSDSVSAFLTNSKISSVEIDWSGTEKCYSTLAGTKYSGRDAFMALCYFNTIVKKKSVQLYAIFNTYLLNLMLIKSDDTYNNVVRGGSAFVEKPLVLQEYNSDYLAQPLTRIRGDFSVAELSIVFNNCLLSDAQLTNLLPSRSTEDIKSMRTMLEITFYNKGVFDFANYKNKSEREDTLDGYCIYHGKIITIFNQEYWGISLTESVCAEADSAPAIESIKNSANLKSAVSTSIIDSAVDVVNSKNSASSAGSAVLNTAIKENASVTVESDASVKVSKPSKGTKAKKAAAPVKNNKSNESSASLKKATSSSSKKTTTKNKAVVNNTVTESASTASPISISRQDGVMYEIVKLYSTGVPWSYAELVFLVEHSCEECTVKAVKAVSGVSRTKTEIVNKKKLLSDSGITSKEKVLYW